MAAGEWTMPGGYYGRVLRVDLGSGEWAIDRLDPQVLRRCIGGIGLGTALLLRYCPAGVDPLAPDAPLILASSPLVGTAVTTTAKFAVLFKSPLTGFIGDSLSSSRLALALKQTSYDAIVISGACARWSSLVVSDDPEQPVRLLPAEALLGLSTWEAERALVQQLAALGLRGARACVIGPAGEHQVHYATISNEGRHAGRCGGGAVMGAKRLKAIAVYGRQHAPVADPKRLRALNAGLIARSTGPATAKYRQLGTPANLLVFDRLGVLPSRNFQASTFQEAEQLSGETLYRDYLARMASCAGCTVGCEHLYKIVDELATEPAAAGPTLDAAPSAQRSGETRLEYESLFALGPLLGIADPQAVLRLARRCDDLGLDTISAGGTLAWAMEAAERGVLPIGAGEPRPRFGDAAGVAVLLEMIARREGTLGDLLAGGSRAAARQVGHGSEAWAMHVKGLELPGYEPRGLKTLALGFAVTPRGACHNRSAAYEADFSGAVDRFASDASRGRLAAAAEDQAAVLDSLILCKFIRRCFDDFYSEAAELLACVTGWDVTGAELQLAGERISTLKKLFNVREGWTRADDTLPPRLLDEPLPDGPGKGEGLTRAELDSLIESYYAARGWTRDGQVPAACLEALGLVGLAGVHPGFVGQPSARS